MNVLGASDRALLARVACAQVAHDHHLAAWTATLKQRKTEKDADAAGMTVPNYLRAIGQYPCTERLVDNARPMDEMELDYMNAAIYATSRERERQAEQDAEEAEAIAKGMTVEEWEAVKAFKL